MKDIFITLGKLVSQAEEDKLIQLLPVIYQTISELIVEIRNSSELESANDSFDMLYVFTVPMACLLFKYEFKLEPKFIEVLQYERIDDPIFRAEVFKKIKNREIFKEF